MVCLLTRGFICLYLLIWLIILTSRMIIKKFTNIFDTCSSIAWLWSYVTCHSHSSGFLLVCFFFFFLLNLHFRYCITFKTRIIYWLSRTLWPTHVTCWGPFLMGKDRPGLKLRYHSVIHLEKLNKSRSRMALFLHNVPVTLISEPSVLHCKILLC